MFVSDTDAGVVLTITMTLGGRGVFAKKNTDENIDDRTDALLISKGWREDELVDWNKPLLRQVSNLGHNYFEWVHSPAPDRQIRLFESDLLESLSVCSWKAIPAFWLPIICMMLYQSYITFRDVGSEKWLPWIFGGVPITRQETPLLFVCGIFTWTLFEYAIHRWMFHLKPPASSRLLIVMHFLFHGQHHKTPMDAGRLVFPPAPALLFGVGIYSLLLAAFPFGMGNAVSAGVAFGYILYDLTHYYLHHGSPTIPYFKRLKHYHVQHHFVNQQKAFGISSKLWDYPFGTLIPE
ncbi:Fatty acid 2-hydroxylase [Lamellibrachia satsuma]|nr:Fatty acid 2-hydroxylase [Lamellibrachia satsuma]